MLLRFPYKKTLLIIWVCILRVTLNAVSQSPLRITIESVDTAYIKQPNSFTKFLRCTAPILANDCNSEQQIFNRTVVAYGRTIVASQSFEELLSIRMREAYVKCINDPYTEVYKGFSIFQFKPLLDLLKIMLV